MPLQALSDGTRIHYESKGTGVPVLVPCCVSSVPYERTFGDALSDDLRLIFVELRGSARSEGTPDLALDRVADDLEDLREQLGLGKVIALGQSRNGLPAAVYARRFPASVDRLVVIGTPLSLRDDPQWYWEAQADETRRRVGEENTRQAKEEGADRSTAWGIVRSFTLDSHRLWYDPHYDMEHCWDASLISPEVLQGTTEQWADVHLRDLLTEIDAPAFAAFGKYDFHVPPTDLLDDVPGVRVEVFDRSGHFPYIEEEEEFAARYRDWVRTT